MNRRTLFLLGLGLFLGGLWILRASPTELWPSEGGRQLAAQFFYAALSPATDYQDGEALSRRPFAAEIAHTLWITVRFALVAMSLALIIGLLGGTLASRTWWLRPSRLKIGLRTGIRLLLTALRSVHELLWAILFLAALGTSPATAVWAIALPFGGTLGKVFAEVLDEAPDLPAQVLRATGSSGLTTFLPSFTAALPDLLTYALYRLECAVRSSAILGFVGIPTVGYKISTAFEDGHYQEIWTWLYALLSIVVALELLGAAVRRRLSNGTPAKPSPKVISLRALHQTRGHSPFLKTTAVATIFLVLTAWLSQPMPPSQLTESQRSANLDRFLSELAPHPVQQSRHWPDALPWLAENLANSGLEALWRTFHLGTVAALLAGGTALLLLTPASRLLTEPERAGVHVPSGPTRRALSQLLRATAILARAMPEFILAFLLLQILGPSIWALILALAVHNGGILLRLGAEVIDNTPPESARILLASGTPRVTTFLGTLLPSNFNRLLLFLFYRWETCIREATVLGVLGVSSLGALIAASRTGFYYDEVLLWILLGASLVFLGDLFSDFLRRRLR